MKFFLKRGDLVGVAAPSARFDRSLFDKGIDCLESMGFKTRVHRGVFGAHRYLAGPDQARARVISELFADPEVKGVISARGGYGAMRILPHLDWSAISEQPTLFMGFSDASSLISALVGRAGMAAVHGPNLVCLARAGRETREGFFRAVTGQLSTLRARETGRCLVPGTARGKLVGGNLATLAHLVGTRFAPDFRGGILFFEDVGEPAYKIDRMLSQMDMAGCFDGVMGVVAGSFENCANPEYIPEILEEIFAPKGIPVCMGLAAGHGDVNLALPMGLPVKLEADRVRLVWDAS